MEVSENRISYLLSNPTEISLSDFSLIENKIKEYPYFYGLKALYLYGLKKEKHPSYDDELKLASLFSFDRVDLYNYIHMPPKINRPSEDVISIPLSENNENLQEDDINLVRENSIHQLVEREEVIEPEEEKPDFMTETISVIEEVTLQKEEPQENYEIEGEINEELNNDTEIQEKADIIAPKMFDPNEKLTFSQWLHISSTPKKEEDVRDIQSLDVSEKNIKFQLIDEFLEKSPKIPVVRKSSETNYNQGIQSEEKEEFSDLMTETLAQIYTEQKKYDKAIKAYKILSLKYPEKSIFFANLIKEIEKLKNTK